MADARAARHSGDLTSLTKLCATAYRGVMPRMVNLYEAKTHLSALVEAAERGEEIIIAKNGVAKAKLTAVLKPRRERHRSGLMKIRYIAEDFDLTDESIIKDFEGSV